MTLRAIGIACALFGCASAPAKPPPAPPPAAAPSESKSAEPSLEAILADSIAMMTEMTTVLETIVDEASATAAVPRLRTLAEHGQQLKARAETVGRSTPRDQVEALRQKYEGPMNDAVNKLAAQAQRVHDIPGAVDAMRAAQLQ